MSKTIQNIIAIVISSITGWIVIGILILYFSDSVSYNFGRTHEDFFIFGFGYIALYFLYLALVFFSYRKEDKKEVVIEKFDFKKFHLRGIAFFTFMNIIISFVAISFSVFGLIKFILQGDKEIILIILVIVATLLVGGLFFFIYQYFRKRLRLYLAEIHKN